MHFKLLFAVKTSQEKEIEKLQRELNIKNGTFQIKEYLYYRNNIKGTL